MSNEELIAEAKQAKSLLEAYAGTLGLARGEEFTDQEPWRVAERLGRLASALEAEIAEADPYCREEACQYRHWTSGPMPTHRRGAGCPEPQPGEGR